MSRKMSVVLLVLIAIVSGLWIWSIALPKKSIILGGSTSVNPFMQKLTKEYYDDKDVDFIYNSTGSQAGVGGVEKDMYSAGFISKDISSGTLTTGNTFVDICNGLSECNFEGVDLKTINNVAKSNSYIALEFAIDAIGVIYNAPSYWNEEITYNNGESDRTITLNDLANLNLNDAGKKIIADIYSGDYQWKDIALELIKPYNNNITSYNQTIFNDFKALIDVQPGTKIVTFTREDGSGTRSAFSDLTGVKNMSTSNVVNSNGSMIENMQRAPSLGYVSNAFLSQLYDGGPIHLAGINDVKLPIGTDNDKKPQIWTNDAWVDWPIEGDLDLAEGETITDAFIKTQYEFKRPFVGIFNLQSPYLDELINLFEYINSDASSVFESEGLVKDMKYKTLQGGLNA